MSATTLPAGALPPGITPVAKIATPFIALDANTLAEFGGRQPEKWEGLAIGPKVGDQYVILAGTDNDFSVTQDSSGVQSDVYYNPANPNASARIQCDIGTFSNCESINADGSIGGAYSGPFDGFALIPGLLYAYLSTGNDLAGFVAQVPLPATWAMLLAGLGLLGVARRRIS